MVVDKARYSDTRPDVAEEVVGAVWDGGAFVIGIMGLGEMESM